MRALAVLGCAALSATVLTACDGEVTEVPFLPDATPSPAGGTPAPGDLEAFRAFAAQVEAAVGARDPDFFMDIAQTSTLACPNEFEPRCEGQPAGSQVQGIWLGRWRSEGTLLTPRVFRQELAAYLDSIPDPSLQAVASLDREAGAIIGGPAFFAVVASAADPADSTRVFEFVSADSEWRLTMMMEATVLAEEWLSGQCGECYDRWERWQGGQDVGY